MVVAVWPEGLDRLDALVDTHQSAETRWQAAAEQEAGLLNLRGVAWRQAHAELRAERDRLREDGRHRVNRWRALAPPSAPSWNGSAFCGSGSRSPKAPRRPGRR